MDDADNLSERKHTKTTAIVMITDRMAAVERPIVAATTSAVAECNAERKE